MDECSENLFETHYFINLVLQVLQVAQKFHHLQFI